MLIKSKIISHELGLIKIVITNQYVYSNSYKTDLTSLKVYTKHNKKNYNFSKKISILVITLYNKFLKKSRISLLCILAFHNSSCFVDTVTVWICTEGEGLQFKVSVSERWPGTRMFIPSVVVRSVISEHRYCRKRVVLDVLKSCSNLKTTTNYMKVVILMLECLKSRLALKVYNILLIPGTNELSQFFLKLFLNVVGTFYHMITFCQWQIKENNELPDNLLITDLNFTSS